MARQVQKGTVLGGRYRLEELIGSGGMGSVYAAYDLDQSHRVAVKLLNARLAKATEFRERFLDESKLASSIPHPHILTVFDHGEDAGWHYLAMRLVEDELAAMIEREGALAVPRALTIADQVAWALDIAHERGLVHRDVKPENVLVTPQRHRDEPDHAYLADFGIAKLADAATGHTRTGSFIGSVSYASPEQARGERLDGRSDQYSLACVLYEMLTGTPPFSGPTSEGVIAAHLEARRPSVSAVRPDLPQTLDMVLARGLAVDRDARFGTCRELVAAARRAVREATAASDGAAPRAGRTSDPRRVPAPTVVPEPRPDDEHGEAAAQEREPAPTPPAVPEPPPTPPPTPPTVRKPQAPLPPAPAAAPAAPAERGPRRFPLSGLIVLAAIAVGAIVAASLLGGDGDNGGRSIPARVGQIDGEAVRLQIVELPRSGSTATLEIKLTLQNPRGNKAQIGSAFGDGVVDGKESLYTDVQTMDGISLLDPDAGKRYSVFRDERGRCVCDRDLSSAFVEGGAPVRLSVTFGGLPDDLDAIDVLVPRFGTFRDVPIS